MARTIPIFKHCSVYMQYGDVSYNLSKMLDLNAPEITGGITKSKYRGDNLKNPIGSTAWTDSEVNVSFDIKAVKNDTILATLNTAFNLWDDELDISIVDDRNGNVAYALNHASIASAPRQNNFGNTGDAMIPLVFIGLEDVPGAAA